MFGRVTVAFLLLPHSSARRDTNADVIQHITHSQGQANTPRGTLAKDSHRLDSRLRTACDADSRLAVFRLAITPAAGTLAWQQVLAIASIQVLSLWHEFMSWQSRRFCQDYFSIVYHRTTVLESGSAACNSSFSASRLRSTD